MRIAPDRTLYFGVDVQAELEQWWKDGGAAEVLGAIDCEGDKTGMDYPLGFATIRRDLQTDWHNPLVYVQYALTYDPNGDADFNGTTGLFQNVAGKGRLALRENVDSIAVETQPWLAHPGDFPYGGWVHNLYGLDGGASGLPGGSKDDAAVRKIFVKIRHLRAAAAGAAIDAVGARVKGANDEKKAKYMLTDDWRLTADGMLVPSPFRSTIDQPGGVY